MKHWVRRILTVTGVALLIWYFHRNADQLLPAWHSLQQLSWTSIFVFVALECGYYLFNASASHAALAAVNVSIPWRVLFWIGLETIYLNTIAPSVGLAGSAPTLLYATETRQSRLRTMIAYALTTAMELSSASLLLLGLITYPKYGFTPVSIAAAILVVLAFGAGLIRAGAPQRVHPVALFQSFVFAALGNACEAIMLIGLFSALGYHASPAAILLVYAWSTVTWYVSPTPQGLGAVELVAGGVLAGMTLPAGAVVIVPILFRLFVHWLPVTLGMLSFSLRRPPRPVDAVVQQ